MILLSILLSVTLVNNIVCSAINEHDIITLENYDDVSKRYLGASKSAFDQSLYDDVNEELCQKQLTYLVNSSLRWDFLDASAKLPSGIKTGNINDLGDYFQCLSIHHIEEESEMDIQGKYCNVYVPLDQPINIPEIPQIPDLPEFPWPLPNQTMTKFEDFNRIKMFALSISGISSDIASISRDGPATRTFPSLAISNVLGAYGVCVPRACSPRQAIEVFQSRLPFVNVTFYENYCRLPGDKPFSGADYTAMAIFGILGVLIIISTAYDVYQTIIVKQDQSRISPLYRCFSVYTNTRRFLTFKSPPGALECVDGIRSISMMWVVVGHVYSMTLLGYIHNMFDVLAWMTNFSSTWINSAPITVDTFFLMSGILVVYTTVGKISRDRFIKSIHLFIINRLLRMFPLLAAVVLLQASVVNHLSDGPFWNNVAISTENCRNYWWSALLHIQNYVNPNEICLIQTWYLSVDVQLYIISPLILVFLFGSQRKAWIALSVILIASLASSTAYSFSYNFSAALANPGRLTEMLDYTSKYYFNTLCRAPPFFVGMLYGYIIHQWRDRKLKIPKMYLRILWLLSFVLMAFCIFTIYPVMQLDHDQQTFDNFLNAYMRAIWAVGLGWLIFACVKGYGGPINWFLSLTMWKLIARLSFAMYLIHIPIILVANGSWTKTYYFSEGNNEQRRDLRIHCRKLQNRRLLK